MPIDRERIFNEIHAFRLVEPFQDFRFTCSWHDDPMTMSYRLTVGVDQMRIVVDMLLLEALETKYGHEGAVKFLCERVFGSLVEVSFKDSPLVSP